MPQSKSSKKAARINEDRRIQNKAVKSSLRTQLKKVKTAIDAGDAKKAEQELPAAMKELDKAAKSNIIHKNQAARRKSRLQQDINRL